MKINLSELIPDLKAGVDAISEIAEQGFVLAFNLSWKGPEHRLVTMPLSWQRIYDAGAYFTRDPVFHWILRNEGAVRWSQVKFPDLFKVSQEAARHGLRFGAVIAVKENDRKSFLSVARSDREVTDSEIVFLEKTLSSWAEVVSGGMLTPEEAEVLEAFSAGAEVKDAALSLGISEAGVKKRLAKASLKLGAKNRAHAVAVALRKGIIG